MEEYESDEAEKFAHPIGERHPAGKSLLIRAIRVIRGFNSRI